MKTTNEILEELAKQIEGNHILSGGNGPNFNFGWDAANECAAKLIRARIVPDEVASKTSGD